MRKLIKSISGENIAFTGAAWMGRPRLQQLVLGRGGITRRGADVTKSTTILVRGDSSVWKFGDYGIKERQAARLIRKGISISIVHDSEFRKLIEKKIGARVADRVAGEPIVWLRPATKRQFERVARIKGPLDREHTVLGRLEQSYLRYHLFGDNDEGVCSICGRRLPVSLLIAAHFKTRSECSKRERLDAHNIVASMCLLGCDALYERGFIAVGEGGRVLLSTAQLLPALKTALRQLRNRKCNKWNSALAPYFTWHLKNRFQGMQ